MSIQSRLATVVAASVLLTLGACATQNAGSGSTAQVAVPATSTMALISSRPELSTFTTLVRQVGLDAVMQASGPMTVFAPTNDAFKALPSATLDKLSKDPEFLKTALSHHIVAAQLRVADVEGARTLTANDGGKLNVSRAGDFLTVDEGLATVADLGAGNGVVHVVDTVLMPPKK